MLHWLIGFIIVIVVAGAGCATTPAASWQNTQPQMPALPRDHRLVEAVEATFREGAAQAGVFGALLQPDAVPDDDTRNRLAMIAWEQHGSALMEAAPPDVVAAEVLVARATRGTWRLYLSDSTLRIVADAARALLERGDAPVAREVCLAALDMMTPNAVTKQRRLMLLAVVVSAARSAGDDAVKLGKRLQSIEGEPIQLLRIEGELPTGAFTDESARQLDVIDGFTSLPGANKAERQRFEHERSRWARVAALEQVPFLLGGGGQ
ncbi:MAG: hypothetical protein IT383_01200 [Deltaproteobacteria bacterium]|nr:hypothetical protein [Deltaproteobacteria bacterium]